MQAPAPSAGRQGWRAILGFNLLTAIVLAVPGFLLGWLLGTFIGQDYAGVQGTNMNDPALILGYAGAILGWLTGLGFLRYPLARIRGEEPSPYAEERTGREGLRRFFELSTDHKVVGVQYLVGALFFFFLAGTGAMLIRGHLLTAEGSAWTPQQYLALVGLHGSMMITTMSAALVGGLGNFLVPLMIGARRTAFPRLQALAFWLIPAALITIISSVFFGGFPTGWTGYSPLSDQTVMGMDAYLVGFGLFAIALSIVGLDLVVTVITMRAPGLTWGRLPLFVWGVFGTAILMAFAAPVLLAAVVMGIFDRTIDSTFFLAPTGGTAFLWEELFWFFGHPEVYILALPGFGIILELTPVFARKPLWGQRAAVAGMLGVTLLSFMVWQHHLFVSGINSDLRPFYSLTTELISIPQGLIFLCAMATMWKARLRLSVPMLFCLAFIFNFLIGGVSGVFLSDIPSNASTHGTYFVMAHFHYTIMGGLVFALFGAIYYWGPRISGVRFHRGLSTLHFWTMFVTFNSTFLPLFAVGILGMPRRVSTYDPSLQGLNVWVSVSAFLLGASMILFLVNAFYSLVVARVPSPPNPWQSRGLEWQVQMPIPPENFDRIPVVRSGPYEYGVPDAAPVADLSPSRTEGG